MHRGHGLLLVAALCAPACGGGASTTLHPPAQASGTEAAEPITWSEQPYPECGGLSPVVLTAVAGDLDGDTGSDTVVGVRCETVTAGAPILVVAFLLDDATGQVTDRKVLVSQCGRSVPCAPGVRNEHLVGDLELAIVDGVVEVAGKAYSDDAPLCCPDLDLAFAFAWTGAGFDQVPRGR